MATIVPQMAKLSVKDLLETRQRLEADILKLIGDFEALTGVKISDVSIEETTGISTWSGNGFSYAPGNSSVRVELAL